MDRRRLRQIVRAGGASPLAARNAIRQLERDCDAEEIRNAPSLADRVGGLHPPAPGYVFPPVMAPSRIIVVANIDELAAAVPPARSLSVEYPVEFDAGSGWMIGIRGSVVNEAAALVRSSIGLRMYFNDGEELITDGRQATFVNYDDLFTQAQTFYPLRRRVVTDDVLYVQFENFNTNTAYTPSLSIMYLRDEDLRAARAMFDDDECE